MPRTFLDMSCTIDRLGNRSVGLEFFHRAVCTQLDVRSSLTIIRNVLHSKIGGRLDTGIVDLVKIETSLRFVRFVPAGIKARFPKMRALEIFNSGLTHLEREDMRQFGVQLTFVGFLRNALTALHADVFAFNANLQHIHFHNVPLGFIDPLFFQNFRRLSLGIARFEDSNCINRISHHPTTTLWNFERCDDQSSNFTNTQRSNERRAFFSEIFPGLG